MKQYFRKLLVVGILAGLGACGKPKTDTTPVEGKDGKEAKVEKSPQQEADEFLQNYQAELARLEKNNNELYWKASISGKDEDFNAAGAAELALRQFLSSPESFKKIKELLAKKDRLDPLTARQLEVAYLQFAGNQQPRDVLAKLVSQQKELEKINSNFRGKIGDKEYPNNELLQMMRRETDSAKRRAAWEALKQVGAVVGPKVVELAKLRNEAARKMGYANFWDMQIRLQEHDPATILRIFEELEKLTAEPFQKAKARLDAELARKFKVKPEDLMPWHYDDPFFQEAPPSGAVDLDTFFKGKKEQDIVDIAKAFFAGIDLPIDDIVERSDFFEKPGKDQHAYCTTIDRGADVRMLLNIKPNARWMDTMLHESGHAVYFKWTDRNLPYNLRDSAHILTTEGVAMMFGALAKNPKWLGEFLKVDAKTLAAKGQDILAQRRLEQLVFMRWALVMMYFEKALYENPDQNLNKVWWDLVERMQMIKRPAITCRENYNDLSPIEKKYMDEHAKIKRGNCNKNKECASGVEIEPPPCRSNPDWAAKVHFIIAPVYYHNYALGELFAAQLRKAIAALVEHKGPISEINWNDKRIGAFLRDKVFAPGMKTPWAKFVEEATGAPFSPEAFAAEVTQ